MFGLLSLAVGDALGVPRSCAGLTRVTGLRGLGSRSIARVVAASARLHQSTAEVELRHFERFISGEIASVAEDTVRSGGYVIDTLEASVWCLLTTRDFFSSAALKAVNLGGDTDTTGGDSRLGRDVPRRRLVSG